MPYYLIKKSLIFLLLKGCSFSLMLSSPIRITKSKCTSIINDNILPIIGINEIAIIINMKNLGIGFPSIIKNFLNIKANKKSVATDTQ